MNDPRWLEWAKRLQATAQNGLEYAADPFDQARFTEVRDVAAEIMAAGSYQVIDHVALQFAAETGHATPKVDVRGVVFRGTEVLLIRERSDGLWSLPGGWADVYDSPAEATVREIFEESGFHTQAIKLLAVLDRDKQGHPPATFHAYKIFFLCRLIGGTATTSIETDDVAFFEEGNLPELSVGRVTRRQLARFFEHLRQPELPTDFE